MQIISNDEGKTFEHGYVTDLPEPIEGCEGSIVANKHSGDIFYSGVTGSGGLFNIYRVNMSIWKSEDEGKTYKLWKVVDKGNASYSALCFSKDGKKLGILWENSDKKRLIF